MQSDMVPITIFLCLLLVFFNKLGGTLGCIVSFVRSVEPDVIALIKVDSVL